jgi:hypothetical protein
MIEQTFSFRRPLSLAMAAAAVVALTWSERAGAQTIVRNPGEHQDYHVELEPHVLAGFFGPPGDGSGVGFGGGIRASFEIVHNGFIPTLNNSIAIGVGTDFLHYTGNGGHQRGTCTRYAAGPAGTNVCVEVSQPGGQSNYAYFPAVLQWNFWLTRQWSAFGEPGLTLYWYDYRRVGVAPALFLGARWHFSDRVTLTMRVGYPTFTVGLSILF